MHQYHVEKLTFHPACEKSTADLKGCDVLVYNPYNGWHEGML